MHLEECGLWRTRAIPVRLFFVFSRAHFCPMATGAKPVQTNLYQNQGLVFKLTLLGDMASHEKIRALNLVRISDMILEDNVV